MKTYEILFKQTGEYYHTAMQPVAVYTPGMVDLEETTDCIMGYDDWTSVTVKKYGVTKVALPDWLSPQEWIRDVTLWRFIWGIPGFNENTPEEIQRALFQFETRLRPTFYKLLVTKNFKSEFRRSLANQVLEWARTPISERKYRSPLSEKQLESLRVSRDDRWITSLYNSSRRGWLFPWQVA